MIIVTILAVLWFLGLLFTFIAQHRAVQKADRQWRINAATFRRLRRKINSTNR
jgi:hypothetical protein